MHTYILLSPSSSRVCIHLLDVHVRTPELRVGPPRGCSHGARCAPGLRTRPRLLTHHRPRRHPAPTNESAHAPPASALYVLSFFRAAGRQAQPRLLPAAVLLASASCRARRPVPPSAPRWRLHAREAPPVGTAPSMSSAGTRAGGHGVLDPPPPAPAVVARSTRLRPRRPPRRARPASARVGHRDALDSPPLAPAAPVSPSSGSRVALVLPRTGSAASVGPGRRGSVC